MYYKGWQFNSVNASFWIDAAKWSLSIHIDLETKSIQLGFLCFNFGFAWDWWDYGIEES